METTGISFRKKLIAFLIFDAAVLLALVFLYSLQNDREVVSELRELGATIYPEARPIEPFSLLDEQGQSFTNSNLVGQWTMLFFGFASCPDICPITMAELKKFYEQIDDPAIKANLNIAMVSVDPMRDTPEVIGAYVNQFNQDFIGVTGDYLEIASVAKQFFIAYSEPVYQHNQDTSATASSNEHAGHDEHMGHEEPAADSEFLVGEPSADLKPWATQPPFPTSLSPTDNQANYLIEHSGHIAIISPKGEFHSVMRLPHRAKDLARAFTQIVENSRF
jgi:protein SCO1/2